MNFDQTFEQIEAAVNFLNGVFFSNTTVYILLATGLVFTFMTGFGQYRALTHGIATIRGKYDDKNDPGAINHFQALSAALSATVGLGNIGGVAAAVALGGPGAVFWMWVIGVVGMALKMTEVTQSMLYRNTDDPDNPHGGPMFVVSKGFKRIGLPRLGALVGGVFCLTLILSAITGGNMFQAWNVAAVTDQYTTGIERWWIGILLAIIVAVVIIGGIKRIGAVAGRIVPLMCGIYVIAALAVLAVNIGEVPAMLGMIVTHGLGLEDRALPAGAFLGGTLGYAFLYGVQRALFSSEAGQGSSPIAHSAAKTDEPVREGVVAGLEPFIDTIVVCTMTALVLLSTGAWDREPEAPLPQNFGFEQTVMTVHQSSDGTFSPVEGILLEDRGDTLVIAPAQGEATTSGTSVTEINIAEILADPAGQQAFDDLVETQRQRLAEKNDQRGENELPPISTDSLVNDRYLAIPDRWMGAPRTGVRQSDDSQRISGNWRADHDVFTLIRTDLNTDTGDRVGRVFGEVRSVGEGDNATPQIAWSAVESVTEPELIDTPEQPAGIYGHYVGAQLTAHAFDRAFPGLNLGKWLILAAVWLFAVSTMISWSYYAEQGVVFLFGESNVAMYVYKFAYVVLVFVSTLDFIETEAQLNMWTTLGLGAMLVANIPIMLLFATQSTAAYNEYVGRLKRGELESGAHKPGSMHDVVTGKDVR